MEPTMVEILKEKGKCCISGKPMSTSRHMNIVALDYAPEWAYPFQANFLMPSQPKRAVAIIHDDEYNASKHYVVPGLVKFAIEIQGKNIIYHPVENLQPIRYGDDKEIEF